LDKINAYENFSRASRNGRTWWAQDEIGHWGYIFEDHDGDVLMHRHRDHALVTRQTTSSLQEPPSLEWLEGMREEYRRRNISTHIFKIGEFIYNATYKVDWRKEFLTRLDIFRLYANGLDGPRENTGFFFLPVDKKMLKKHVRSLFTDKSKLELDVENAFRLVSRAINPTTTNEKSFNEQNWLFGFYDSIIHFFVPGSQTAFSDLVDDIRTFSVQNLISNLTNTVIDYAICHRPQDYNGTNPYKLSCIPNVPQHLEIITPVPNRLITVQFPWPSKLLQSGSCIQPNSTPTSSCGAGDGGVRPLCPICHHCIQSFKSCTNDIGFDGISDSLIFSISTIPRTLEIVLHPSEHLGIFGQPSVAVAMSLLAPSYAQALIYSIVGGTLISLPAINIIFPGAWKVTTALAVSTLLYDYPHLQFSTTKPLLSVIDFSRTNIIIGIIPEELWDFANATVSRFDYDEPWNRIPAEDGLCFFWTLGYFLAPWVLFVVLIMPFMAPLISIVKDILSSLVSLGNSLFTSFGIISRGLLRLEVENNRHVVLEHSEMIEVLDKRLTKIESNLPQPTRINLETIGQPFLSSSSSIVRQRKVD